MLISQSAKVSCAGFMPVSFQKAHTFMISSITEFSTSMCCVNRAAKIPGTKDQMIMDGLPLPRAH